MLQRTLIGCALLLVLTALPVAAENQAAPDQPNVVFILVDDLGYTDVGCYGSSFYETPSIDRLAAEGMKFTDGYAACPVCSPTRASLMSGQWPQRVGVTDYIGAPQPEQWKRNTTLLPAAYNERLSLETRTLAEMFKDAGYATFFAGKWHLGAEGWWPEDQGFDINIGGIDRGGPYGGKKYFSPYGNPRLKDGPEGEHLPARLGEETAQFILQHRDKPFFAYLSFYSVHTPLMGRPDLVEKYKEKKKQQQLQAKWGREGMRDVRLVQEHAVYAAMVEAMDQAVGRVLEALDEAGVADETLVVFTSDNGGLSTSEGWPTSNLPLRGGKGWMYEGGIREPMIVRWPEKIAAGTVEATPISSPDFYATFLEVSGGQAAENQVLDGVSLTPLFAGEAIAERPLFWHYPHYGNQGGAPAAAVRLGDWKLIEWYEDQRVELFNLKDDIAETHDLANAEPERVQELQKLLSDWRLEVGAKFPSGNSAFDPSKPNGRAAKR